MKNRQQFTEKCKQCNTFECERAREWDRNNSNSTTKQTKNSHHCIRFLELDPLRNRTVTVPSYWRRRNVLSYCVFSAFFVLLLFFFFFVFNFFLFYWFRRLEWCRQRMNARVVWAIRKHNVIERKQRYVCVCEGTVEATEGVEKL